VYEFALVRHQGTPPAYGHHQGKPSKTTRGVRSVVSAFGGKDNNCGWDLSRFISIEDLERSSFLKDDCFAVWCTVTVVRERIVKEKVVQAADMARLGMLYKCDDDLCKRHHARTAAETFLVRFANFCYSICRGPIHYGTQELCRGSTSLLRVKYRALGKESFAESLRSANIGSRKAKHYRKQYLYQVSYSLPRAKYWALGKESFAESLCSANTGSR
jgi:hypothetical protein